MVRSSPERDSPKRSSPQKCSPRRFAARKPSQLHEEILAYSRGAAPSMQDTEAWEQVIHRIRRTCFSVMRQNIQVTPFGSYANGLATKSSDIDLVITGVLKPNSPHGFFGYPQFCVARHLCELEKALIATPELGVRHSVVISRARIPILKLTTMSGVMVDISINDNSCSRAAHFVLEKVRQYPSVRPICILLKEFLRTYHLNEVKDGGLGGYALANLVIAHVLEMTHAGFPTHDFGNVLLSFLDLYGNKFDSETQAVSVRRGGIVSNLWMDDDGMDSLQKSGFENCSFGTDASIFGERWYIENPLTGLNISQGSFNVSLIRQHFIQGFNALNAGFMHTTVINGKECVSRIATLFKLYH